MLFRFKFLAACLVFACVPGCNSRQSRAAEAYAEYQSASARNDLMAARRALSALVAAEQDNVEAWSALGRLQLASGEYGGAYNAFNRAQELDRGNPELLRTLTQIALMSGEISLAKSHAADLSIIAPDDIWVQLTAGYEAVIQQQFERALIIADKLLESYSFDAAATGLKARALIGLGREAEARALLEVQIESQPTDLGSAGLLAKLYRLGGDWDDALRVARRIVNLDPSFARKLFLAEAAFRSKHYDEGRQISREMVFEVRHPHELKAILALWRDYWPSAKRVTDAARFGRELSDSELRLIFAEFLSWAGASHEAVKLTGVPRFPITATNAETHAVFGSALVRNARQAKLGKRHLDAVLKFDPGNETALRARTKFFMRTGTAVRAVHDAQKLVSVSPSSTESRMLLAEALSAAGRNPEAARVLWQAFHSIKANDALFGALLSMLRDSENEQANLRREFAAQRRAEILGELL